ncbi:DUF3135 domain-containing protein [Hydrocarboniclastica marina]|uniref:DUF3135 domain-containing protein n=2 Tax=Hydrocarboniclastica marina TaxID=2259620 RepID=A0A4P7XIX8_9ALTE|nr:DUF3135 domain-containing protein [Hydrocarboniclastica marina]
MFAIAGLPDAFRVFYREAGRPFQPGSSQCRGLNRAATRTSTGTTLMEKPPFDQLKKLASTDPAAFEQLRSDLLEDFIQSTPPAHHQRLRGLQFVVDSRRSLAKTPVKAMLEIQSMMHGSLEKLRQSLNRGRPEHQRPPSAHKTGNVVSIQRHH